MPNATLSAELQKLADLGVQRSYRKGAIILNEGESGDAIYVLLRGSVRAFGASVTGKEITFGTLHAGDFFGEMALDGGSRSASVEALEPCLCAVVANAHVLAFMRDHHEFAISLIHKTIARARAATQSARDMALLDVYARLAQTINKLASINKEDAAPKTIAINITHAALAGLVGASREMVSKLMKDLERGGYIQTANRQITLLKKLPARW